MGSSSTIVYVRLPQYLVDVYKVLAKEQNSTLSKEMERALFRAWEHRIIQSEEETTQEATTRREHKILYYIQYLQQKKQAPTSRDLGRYLPHIPKDILVEDITRLVQQGKVSAQFTGRSYRYTAT